MTDKALTLGSGSSCVVECSPQETVLLCIRARPLQAQFGYKVLLYPSSTSSRAKVVVASGMRKAGLTSSTLGVPGTV